MTIATPLTGDRVRTHFTYSAWKYVIMCVGAIFAWSLIYTQTAYRSPQNKRIDVYIKSGTASSEVADAFMEPIWKASVPDMETVSSVVMMPGDDYTNVMQLSVYVMAGEVDIFFLPSSDFKTYAAQGAFLPLEQLIADGAIDAGDIDVSAGRVAYVEEYGEDGAPLKSEMHLFGIPTDSLYGFMENMLIDNRGMVMCITVANNNDDNVIPFFNALLQAGRGEVPEWLNEDAGTGGAETPDEATE